MYNTCFTLDCKQAAMVYTITVMRKDAQCNTMTLIELYQNYWRIPKTSEAKKISSEPDTKSRRLHKKVSTLVLLEFTLTRGKTRGSKARVFAGYTMSWNLRHECCKLATVLGYTEPSMTRIMVEPLSGVIPAPKSTA